MDFKYRNVELSDLEEIVDVHIRSFQGFFLSSLGKDFLRTYYSACFRSTETVFVCAVENNSNRIVGFCLGCLLSKGFHSRLIFKNLILFLVQGLKILFTNLNSLLRLYRNISKSNNDIDLGEYSELLSICVDKNYSNLGIGKSLIELFEENLVTRDCREIVLTTDFYNNDNVIYFYDKLGYKNFYDFIAYPNRRMYKLKKNLRLNSIN